MLRSALCLLVLAIASVEIADACSCIQESEDKRVATAHRFETASLIFVGRIESTERLKLKQAEDFEIEYQRTQFYILESWKGETASRMFIQSAITCCLCGYEFPESGVFLVFAYGPDRNGYYEATSCTPPLRRSEATEEIAILNDLVGVRAGNMNRKRSSGATRTQRAAARARCKASRDARTAIF